MNPALRQMRACVALARTGNFTLAAQYLHVTQSALSGLIKELEQTLGVRVLDRSTRRIALTGTGNELYPLFGQMIDGLDRALANLADQAQRKAREPMEMPFEAVVPPDHPLAGRNRPGWSGRIIKFATSSPVRLTDSGMPFLKIMSATTAR